MTPRRPAVMGAIAFVLGTLGGLHWGDAGRGAWIALGVVFILSFVPRRPSPRLWLRYSFCLFLGWALAAGPGNRLRASQMRLEEAADAESRVTVQGEVVGTIRTSPASRGETCYRFMLNRLDLLADDRREPLPRLAISVSWYGPSRPDGQNPVPRLGERWRMTGALHRTRRSLVAGNGAGPSNTIRFFMISRARASTRELRPTSGWQAWLEGCRRVAAGRLAAGIEKHADEVKLIQAMMLGYRSEIPRSLNRAFRQSGTIHIFAISGLHIVVLAALLTFAVARLGVPRRLWIVPLAPILALYIVATGGQPSALRAGVMAGLYLLAPLLGRRPDSLTILAVSAVLLLLVDPLQILDLGFILSFMMVLGLIILAGPTTRCVRRLVRVERLVRTVELMNQQGGDLALSKWRLRGRSLGVKLATSATELFGVSLAAWLVSLPLTAYYFGFFPTYSLLANLLVIPLSSLVMLLASLSLVVASVSAHLGVFCNQGVWLGTALMKQTAVTVTGWPLASFKCSMSLAGVVIWYVAIWGLAWREARAHAKATSDATWMETVRDEKQAGTTS